MKQHLATATISTNLFLILVMSYNCNIKTLFKVVKKSFNRLSAFTIQESYER